MTPYKATHVARHAGTYRFTRVELETAKKVLEDLLACIEQTLANAPSEMVRETGE